MRFVLASASPARLQTLQAAGIHPEVHVSQVDEAAAVAQARNSLPAGESLEPGDIALLLAREKAQAVSLAVRTRPPGEKANKPAGPVILGCDSLLTLGEEIYGKPRTATAAISRWKRMRGTTGLLHTGHWLIDDRADGTGATFGQVAATEVDFADISDAEIAAYIATGEPLQVAGAFTIDGLGGPYISGVRGDHHNVVGLSLPVLREMFSTINIPWRDLRAAYQPE